MTLAPARRAASIPAAIARVEELAAAVVDVSAQVPGASARKLTIVASNATPMRVRAVAGRGGDRADRRAVAVLVADSAVAGDVAAGRVDPAGELGEVGIDAAVDDSDLDALAGRAGLVGGDAHWPRRQ